MYAAHINFEILSIRDYLFSYPVLPDNHEYVKNKEEL